MDHDVELAESLLSGDGDHDRDGVQETKMQQISHTFQKGGVYRNIEDLNKQALKGGDGFCLLCDYLSKLPEFCLGPCSALSACLAIILVLLYLAGIIWLSVYDIYEIQYNDTNNAIRSASLILNCDEETCLSNQYVCDFYGFNECSTDNYQNDINKLNKIDLFPHVLIKIEYFIALVMWARLRYVMNDMKIFSLTYLLLVIFCNIISYMFRHVGFIYYDKHCKVMYTPYFSDDFIYAIISFIIAFVVWFILAAICLKREGDRLVLRWGGNVVDRRRSLVDTRSVIANVSIWLIFFYCALGSAVWIGVENYAINIEDFAQNVFSSDSDSDSGSNHHYTSLLSFIEFAGTTILQYFLPKIRWWSPYVLAAICTNLLLIVDITKFILKIIRDIVNKMKQWRQDKREQERIRNRNQRNENNN